LLLFATGAARTRGLEKIDQPGDKKLTDFKQALNDLMLDLAHQVVKDGEGARKFIEIQVIGASSSRSAKKIALSVANSPLVKTAIAGEDANWGRVVMAVGKAGEKAERDRLSIWFGDIRVAHKGLRDPDYNEAEVSQLMKKDFIIVKIDLGIGKGAAKVWTCDLTKEYIAINGDYRS
jgi:glutamate N-acetyltransferase/amino-acid N-acetyltransferase